ncbi:PAS domain-containing protein [Pelagibius marinus]|uniref:PAS domain-containing protein n=1 Tax=Pelagibius marinus TaxID=2762760 RepID=UPI00187259A0|nr:PAS domain-containing protein [Pelagibius marinus]
MNVVTGPLPHSASAPLLALRSPINQVGYDYWKRKRGQRRMPTRGDIDPSEMVKILPHVFLLDVRQAPLDFRYRLVGTKMDEHMLARYTGRWMSEIPHQAAPSRIWANCRQVVMERRPISGDTPYIGKNKDFLTTEDLIMPLSDDDDTVDMLFVTVGFV